jgi:hypothetical protein
MNLINQKGDQGGINMGNRDLCITVYNSLLQAAEKTDQYQLRLCIENGGLNTLQSIQVIQLAMEGYRYPTQGVRSTSCDKTGEDRLLSNRILIIKSLIEILHSKVNNRYRHPRTIDYFFYRLRYKPLLVRQKSSLLIWAVRTESIDMIKWLSERNMAGNKKQLALELALTAKKIKSASYLYTQGGTIGTVHWDFFVHSIIQMQDIITLKIVLERECKTRGGMPRLEQMMIDVMKEKQDNMLSLCLEHLTQNVQSLSLDGLEKVLLYAARQSYTSVLRVLVRRLGMSVDVLSPEGKTPLLTAVSYGCLPTVDFLLKNGAKVDIADINGMTPLKAALYRKRLDIFERLLVYASALDVSAMLEEVKCLHQSPCQDGQYAAFDTLLKQRRSILFPSSTM